MLNVDGEASDACRSVERGLSLKIMRCAVGMADRAIAPEASSTLL